MPEPMPCKYSMADAGRLALAGEPVKRSKARDEILLGAARLWCRDLSAPTVRAIGMAVGRSPVTVLSPFGTALLLYAQVIRLEWDLLQEGWTTPPGTSAWRFLDEHVRQLAGVDRVLLRLPALVHAALPGGVVDDRTLVLYGLAAHASSSLPIDTVLAQLRWLDVGAEAA